MFENAFQNLHQGLQDRIKNKQLIFVKQNQVNNKIASSLDVIKIHEIYGNYVLPKYCPIRFLKQHQEKRKNLLKKKHLIPPLNIDRIHFEELSVRSWWTQLKDDKYIASFFPDYPPTVIPERSYFYNIINTIFPNSVNEFYKHAIEKRDLQIETENIAMKTEIFDMYENQGAEHFKPSKRGKAIHQLKIGNMKTKYKTYKTRKTIPRKRNLLM